MLNSSSNDMVQVNPVLNLIEFYNENLQPYQYNYNLIWGINLSFTFEPSEIPHLIFGTAKNFRNSSDYKGEKGYNKIVAGEITQPPSNLRNAFKEKSKAFKLLPDLLRNPTIYHFNPKLVKVRSVNGAYTDIDGEFLLHKGKTHLFVKWTGTKFVPNSLIFNSSEKYTFDQIKMDIISERSTFKCYKQNHNNLTSVV